MDVRNSDDGLGPGGDLPGAFVVGQQFEQVRAEHCRAGRFESDDGPAVDYMRVQDVKGLPEGGLGRG